MRYLHMNDAKQALTKHSTCQPSTMEDARRLAAGSRGCEIKPRSDEHSVTGTQADEMQGDSGAIANRARSA